MKKLIAISVVFALVAGAAFAADIGVELDGHVNLIEGKTNEGYHTNSSGDKEKDPPAAGGAFTQVRLTASGENDDGTFGGWFRWDSDPWAGGSTLNAQGHAWWKPIEQLKLLIGGGPDGRFERSGITRWGFYGKASDIIIKPDNAWGAGWGWSGLDLDFNGAFYQGWDKAGLDLIITPTEDLEINIAIPFITDSGNEVMYVYRHTTAQVAYNLGDIGNFALTFQSGAGYNEEKGWAESTGTVWGYFHLGMIENLGIDFGIGYELPTTSIATMEEEDPDDPDETIEVPYKTKHYAPIAIGLGVQYDAGDFGVKARTTVSLAGKDQADGGDADPIPMALLFDVLPYYSVSDSLKFLFSFGIGYVAQDNDAGGNKVEKSRVAWHVQPYIEIKSSWWAPNFYAGIRLDTNGKEAYGKDGDATSINWSVPIGIAFAF